MNAHSETAVQRNGGIEAILTCAILSLSSQWNTYLVYGSIWAFLTFYLTYEAINTVRLLSKLSMYTLMETFYEVKEIRWSRLPRNVTFHMFFHWMVLEKERSGAILPKQEVTLGNTSSILVLITDLWPNGSFVVLMVTFIGSNGNKEERIFVLLFNRKACNLWYLF